LDELTNGQAVRYYSKHRLTALVAYITDYASVRIDQWPMSLPCLPVGQLVKN